jgi:hypothetical protein
MGVALAQSVIERQRRRLRGKAKRIAIELDPTDDPTHGNQQLTLFNGHYDTWCYLPAAGFVQFDAEPEQYLFTYVLRSGKAPAKLGAIGILARVYERLRKAFPKARLFVRLDGGFANPQILQFLEAERVAYTIAMAGNAVLDRFAEPWMKRVRTLSGASEFRVLMTAAAYVLMQELRTRAAGTQCARAQVWTLRERLFKLGVWVTRSVRRVVLHLPQSAPWRADWCQIARRPGASSG